VEWGIAIILIMLLAITYVVVQETRAQYHWRGLVEQGDVEAIRQLVDAEAERWHTERVPRGVPAMLWHGVQTVEVVDVTANGAYVTCSAEGEFAVVGGRRVETGSALSTGMKVTMKLAEMLFYDVPNVKLDHVQIDVYTSFRNESGRAEPRCILSTLVNRSVVEHIDWEETDAADFAVLTEARFNPADDGALRPIEPLAWQNETRSS
jgi:hypothetical protein